VDAPGVIAVLPDHVVDQIAAGEVVERPASVVKELVENALDAGARSITIEVEAGGRALVRIVDDGSGMSPGDARLALSRHATSKLRHVDDLHDLVTMGFRGEALPSIASVSRMTLTTRRRGDLAAIRIVIDGGRVTDVAEIGAPVGTTIEVRDLLHNVPARLKFLKGEATEASHVTDAVVRLAMAHPQVHVRLRHGGRTAIEAPPCTSGVERVQSLLGPRFASRLHAVDGEENGVRVTAYLAAPELAQTTGRGVQLYVGRRSVRDRGLLHALTMGYGELVPRGRYPVAVVFVDCPAGVVDVNVHPQKLEVRFSDAQAVAAAVRHVVRRGVAQAPWLDEAAGASPVRMHAVVAPAPPRASDVAASYAAAAGRVRLGPAPLPAQETLDLVRPVPAPPPAASWADRMRAAIAAKPTTAPRVARAPRRRRRRPPIRPRPRRRR
jgi:DNA mismatch repair protein MutL